jgi:hypothetical protein
MTRAERIKRQLNYHKKVEKAWKEAKELGEEIGFLRRMILSDVYFLFYYILERHDICYEEWWENDLLTIDGVEVPKGEGDELVKDSLGNIIEDPKKGRRWRYYRPFLFERCQEIQREPDGYLDIWSRDHYKSSIITFGMTVQEILKNPEITICIYSYNVSTAQKMLVQIKNALQGNQILLMCFPEILFTNTNVSSWKDEFGNSHKMEWSNDGFNVKRKGNPKEHTLECSGLVTGQKTGGHYNLLIYDDTVTPESVATKSQIEKTTSQFEMSLNTGSTANMRIRMIGTRYALGDTYEKILKDGTVKLRKYPCVDDDGKSVLYSEPVLKWKLSRMHGSVVATQMYCDPQANSAFNFLMEWIPPRIALTEVNMDAWNWYIIVDPAQKVSDDADNTIMWAVGVSGRGDDKTFLWADLIRDKLSLEGKQKALFDLVARFTNSRKRPTVFYERVSMQSDIQHYQYVMNQTGYVFDILEASGKPKLNYGMTASGSNLKFKDLRISALQPSLKQGRHRFVDSAVHVNWKGKKEDMLATFFEEEYVKYPFGEHDDGLDAMCRVVDLDVGVQMVGIDMNEYLRKKKEAEKHKGINYFSKDTYQPYRIKLTS